MGTEAIEKLSLAGASSATPADPAGVLQRAQSLLASGELAAARQQLEAARSAAREAGDRAVEAAAIGLMAGLESTHREPRRALQLWERAQSMWRELGDSRCEAE